MKIYFVGSESPDVPVKLIPRRKIRWLNRTVLGIGLASLFSDLSHEMATTIMPAFLATMGVAAAWLGLIEGVSDGLSSFAKLASGYYTDYLQRRKPIAILGYALTTLGVVAFGLATAAWQVLILRATAWFGRGIRTPVRKALLAAAVDRETYGRAFGFERMMDTLGAIIAPALVWFLLPALHHHYANLFALTLIPGVLAVSVIVFLVKEKERAPVPHISFGSRLRALPGPYRQFLIAVGLFGAGAFAHTLLILLATQKLTARLGATGAASAAVALYLLHNVFYASFALIGGWIADRVKKKIVLAVGYSMAALMAIAIIALPVSIWTFALIFILGGTNVALEETAEDSFCAELVREEHHGMAFGMLATVNGVGDFLSSMIVGLLWTAFGTTIAFGYSAILFIAGALLVARVESPHRSFS
jgi:MFS family permease